MDRWMNLGICESEGCIEEAKYFKMNYSIVARKLCKEHFDLERVEQFEGD